MTANTSLAGTPPKASKRWTQGVVACVLFAGTFGLFSRTLGNDFVNLDDPDYIQTNAHVRNGLTSDNIEWAFTTFDTGNWHPLTWLSLQLDTELTPRNRQAGLLSAWAYHRTNAFLHAASTALLFLSLSLMTGAPWRSAFVAALFASHPLRVESVAWIAERKDVLSGLFFMLTLLAYGRYARRPSVGLYIAVLLAMALGLLAKPMLVTLPFVLLLLDYWPLRRSAPTSAVGGPGIKPPASAARLIAEKIPFFALAAASCVITLQAQHAHQAVRSTSELTTSLRFQNALAAYGVYLRKTFWPVDLGVFYPHLLDRLPRAQVALGAGVVVLVSLLALALGGRHRYLRVGWLWFIGMLLPVIGLIQVGGQAYADRYTYLPSIGLFLMLVWTVAALTASVRLGLVGAAGGVAAVGACAALSWQQIGYWRDSAALWEHTLRVAGPSAFAHAHLANGLAYPPGRPATPAERRRAIQHYEAALAERPDYALVRMHLALALIQEERYAEALPALREVLADNPNNGRAHYELSVALFALGQEQPAKDELIRSLELDRRNHDAAVRLAEMAWELATESDPKKRNGKEALRLAELASDATRLHDAMALDALAAAHAEMGQFEDAVVEAEQAARLTRDREELRARLERVALYRDHRPYRQPQAAPKP